MMTYVEEWQLEHVSGGEAEECVGTWGDICDALIPEIRNQLRLTWITPWNLELSGLWRYIDSVENEAGGLAEDLDSYNYLDIAGLWQISDTVTLRAGVNNVLDEAPPLATKGRQGTGNTIPGIYDALGQYWFAGITLSL